MGYVKGGGGEGVGDGEGGKEGEKVGVMSGERRSEEGRRKIESSCLSLLSYDPYSPCS